MRRAPGADRAPRRHRRAADPAARRARRARGGRGAARRAAGGPARRARRRSSRASTGRTSSPAAPSGTASGAWGRCGGCCRCRRARRSRSCATTAASCSCRWCATRSAPIDVERPPHRRRPRLPRGVKFFTVRGDGGIRAAAGHRRPPHEPDRIPAAPSCRSWPPARCSLVPAAASAASVVPVAPRGQPDLPGPRVQPRAQVRPAQRGLAVGRRRHRRDVARRRRVRLSSSTGPPRSDRRRDRQGRPERQRLRVSRRVLR